MRKNKSGWIFFPFLLLATCWLTACSNKDDEGSDSGTTLKVECSHTCFIVNMGNYSESNGSIATMRQGESISQNRFSQANGYKLRSIIESAAFGDGYVLLMCGNEDKVAILDANTYKEACTAITGIGLPRYAAIIGHYAYVTCVNPTWTDTIGHIVKIDLDSKKVVNSIKVKGNPEEIRVIDGQLYATSGYRLYQIDPTTDSIVRAICLSDPSATARYLRADASGRIWVSYTHYDAQGYGTNCGIAAYTPGGQSFGQTLPLAKMSGDGIIDLSPDGNTLYYLYASEVVGGRSPEPETGIYRVDLTALSADSSALCTGHGFYGFNVDPSTGNIYTANVNGFVTNSMISIFDSKGKLLQNDLMAGVGTCRFYFR